MLIEISYINLSIPECINKLSKDEGLKELDYLSCCYNYMNDGADFPEAWTGAVKNSKLPFKTVERDELSELSGALGTSDILGQKRVLGIVIECFKGHYDSAAEIQKKYGTVFVTGGVFAGCLLFVTAI